MLNRRRFLLTAGAAAVSSILHPAAPFAAEIAATTSPKILVDWHSHFVTQAEIDFFRQRRQAPRLITGGDGQTLLENVTTVSAAALQPSALAVSDVEARLKQLNQHSVGRQLLTHTIPLGLDATIPVEELRPLFRKINDELATITHKYPDRFLAVAAVPSADPHWAAEELTRAHKELGFIGVSLPLNAFSTLAGARTLAPLFAAGQKHGSHFFVHRGPASSRVPGQPPLVVPEDTEYARWTLISNAHLAAGGITLTLTDFLDPYPDVTVEVVMLAGFLPYLTDSVVPAAQRAGVKDPLNRLRRIYYDTGPYSRIGDWVAHAVRKIGADRILFGTDYGVGGGTRGDLAASVATLEQVLSPDERQRIFVDNSRELLRRQGIVI